MALKKIKSSDRKDKGGYLVMYFPRFGVVSTRADCVVCRKKAEDSGPLFDKAGKPTKKAKVVKPSDDIREGSIEYSHSRRLYGIYCDGDPGIVQEAFKGLFAFVPYLDQNVEERVRAACEAHSAKRS